MKKFIALALSVLMLAVMLTVFTSAAPANVAKGKTYTVAKIVTASDSQWLDPDHNKLTDGAVPIVMTDMNNRAFWVGQISDEDDGRTSDWIVELGSVTNNLFTFRFYSQEYKAWTVMKPASVKVAVSSDGTTYTDAGTMTEKSIFDAAAAGMSGAEAGDGIYQYTLALSTAVSAKFVKFTVNHGSNWAFGAELEVYQGSGAVADPKEVREEVSIPILQIDVGVADSAATIVTRNSDKATDGVVISAGEGGINLRYATYVIAEPTSTAGVFKIIAAESNPGETAKSLTIPVGGFLFTTHSDGSAEKVEANERVAALKKIRIGDLVKITGVDLTTSTLSEGAKFDLILVEDDDSVDDSVDSTASSAATSSTAASSAAASSAAATSSKAATSSQPGTGDTGIFAIALLAIISVTGVALAVKKRK